VEKVFLACQNREAKATSPAALRKKGIVPGVVYGLGKEPQALQVDEIVFNKTYKQAGENTIIALKIGDGQPINTLIYDYQRHPVSDRFLNIDFIRIDLTEEIETEVEIEFVGESPAVKNMGGMLITNKDKVEIKCLPEDLIHKIIVDISTLKEIGDTVHVSNLEVPEKVHILDEPDLAICTVVESKIEKEMEDIAAADATEAAAAEAEAKEGEKAPVEGEEEKKDEEGGSDNKEGDKKK